VSLRGGTTKQSVKFTTKSLSIKFNRYFKFNVRNPAKTDRLLRRTSSQRHIKLRYLIFRFFNILKLINSIQYFLDNLKSMIYTLNFILKLLFQHRMPFFASLVLQAILYQITYEQTNATHEYNHSNHDVLTVMPHFIA
jgi:hypothetical protein